MPSPQIKALAKIMPFYRIKKYRKYIHMKKRRKKMLKKERTLNLKIKKTREEKAITLIALVITIALNCLRSGRKLECVA